MSPAAPRVRVVLILSFLVAVAACSEAPSGSSATSSGSGAGGAGGAPSVSSSAASSTGGDAMTVGSGGTTSTGEGGATEFSMTDPLKNGTANGNAVGGEFGPDGWTVTGSSDRMWFAVPRLVKGSIEFTMSNVTMNNLVVNDNEVFALYEAGYGIEEPIGYDPEFRNNFYKSMLRIYGQQEVGREGQQKLMWGMCPAGAPGFGVDGCPCGTSFFDEPFGGDVAWDGSPQRMRVEWGDGVTRYLRNDVEVLAVDWSASGLTFGPSELHFSLGTSRATAVGDASMPIGAVFSDVVVEGVTGPAVVACP